VDDAGVVHVVDGVDQVVRIFAPIGTDRDDNGIVDCLETLTPPCPWDCVPPGGNGVVNIDDLLAVINAFGGRGPCDSAPQNPDGTFGNGVVNIDDLLGIINAFGPCPQ